MSNYFLGNPNKGTLLKTPYATIEDARVAACKNGSEHSVYKLVEEQLDLKLFRREDGTFAFYADGKMFLASPIEGAETKQIEGGGA
jgi:hypothetical protein